MPVYHYLGMYQKIIVNSNVYDHIRENELNETLDYVSNCVKNYLIKQLPTMSVVVCLWTVNYVLICWFYSLARFARVHSELREWHFVPKFHETWLRHSTIPISDKKLKALSEYYFFISPQGAKNAKNFCFTTETFTQWNAIGNSPPPEDSTGQGSQRSSFFSIRRFVPPLRQAQIVAGQVPIEEKHSTLRV